VTAVLRGQFLLERVRAARARMRTRAHAIRWEQEHDSMSLDVSLKTEACLAAKAREQGLH